MRHISFKWCRKLKLKRVTRVPAISSKTADIPPDDYSWRKYGQKPIKGSPHPRYVNAARFGMSLCMCLVLIDFRRIILFFSKVLLETS